MAALDPRPLITGAVGARPADVALLRLVLARLGEPPMKLLPLLELKLNLSMDMVTFAIAHDDNDDDDDNDEIVVSSRLKHLQFVLRHGALDAAEVLLRLLPRHRVIHCDGILIAAARGGLASLRWLLALDVRRKLRNVDAAFMAVAATSAQSGAVEMLRALRDHARRSAPASAVFAAVHDFDVLRALAGEFGLDLAVRSAHGETLLHNVCDPLVADWLHSSSSSLVAAIDAIDQIDRTALASAAYFGRVSIVARLLDAGARVDQNTLAFAFHSCDVGIVRALLRRASALTRRELDELLLRSDVACDVAQCLLAAGADPNARSESGRTPILVRVARQHCATARRARRRRRRGGRRRRRGARSARGRQRRRGAARRRRAADAEGV